MAGELCAADIGDFHGALFLLDSGADVAWVAQGISVGFAILPPPAAGAAERAAGEARGYGAVGR
jgi:hypothetical protein